MRDREERNGCEVKRSVREESKLSLSLSIESLVGMASSREKRVCVTGASGFIGSWLVRFLLLRGYHVRGTVQNLGDVGETEHLMSFEGAETQLELFEADLLDYQSLAFAIGNSKGVFHLASPVSLEPSKDPQREIIDPAVQGTLNVLKASHTAKVQRVVVTSSRVAMLPSPHLPPDMAADDENTWTDIEHCKETGAWYPISKVLAEKAAWKFAEETGLDVAVINPGVVMGTMLQPRLNTSSGLLLKLLQGSVNSRRRLWMGIVNVQDVAQAHILIYESQLAKGRHVCASEILHYDDFVEEVAKMYPQYNVHRYKEDKNPGLVGLANPSKKLMSLGFTFTPREKIINESVSSLQDKGFL